MESKQMYAIVDTFGDVLEVSSIESVLQDKINTTYSKAHVEIKECHILFGRTVIIKFFPGRDSLIHCIKLVRAYTGKGLAEAKNMVDSGSIVCESVGLAARLMRELQQHGRIIDVIGLNETEQILFGVKLEKT